MSKIALQGDASGTGTFTVAAPNSNSNYTLTLPENTGTIVTTGGASSLTTSGNLTFTGTGNRITGDFSNATIANRVAFQSSTTNGATALIAIPNGTSTTASFGVLNTSDPVNTSLLNLIATSTEVGLRNAITGTGTYVPMTFYTGGSERMRIDTSGNVLIGSSTANAKLYSYATSGTTTTLGRFEAAIGSYTGTSLIAANTLGASSTFNLFSCITDSDGDAGGPFTQFLVRGDGNVSIGTSTNSVYDAVAASRPLVVQSSSSTTTQYGSTNSITICNSDTTTNNASQLNFAAITGASVNQYSSAVISCIYGARTNAQYPTGILTFGTSSTTNTAPSEKMRITSPGKILFNTTTQNNNEQVGMVYSSNDGVGFSIKDSNAQNGNTFIEFRNGATLAGTITSNGTTTMTYGSASDYRLKSNPQPIQNALATVSALNPVSFTWNQTGEQGIGFIAHEVQAVMPDCVVGQKDAEDDNGNPLYQMIDTGSASLIATLTAAIQELKAITDAQATRIEALEAEVAALKGQ